MNILVVNGPNLNLLGIREPEIYGTKSYFDLLEMINDHAGKNNHYVEIHQSNHEGGIIDILHQNYKRFEGVVINPGAYAHYSYAIYDCLKAINVPAVEVHLSDVLSREDFRKKLVTKDACIALVSGKGIAGYMLAIDLLAGKETRR